MSSQIITIDNIEPKVITIDNVATEVITVETIETITIEGVGIRGATGPAGSGGTWGTITGTLSDQIDLKNQQDAQDSAIALNTDKVTFPEAPEDGSQYARKDAGWEIVSADVDSVNGQTGIVVLDTDDIDDSTQLNKYTTAGDISKLAGIEAGAQVNTVDSVNTKTGAVIINPDDLDDSATVNKFVTASQIIVIDNQSGVNTGDQDLSGIETDISDLETAVILIEGEQITQNAAISLNTDKRSYPLADETRLSNTSGTNTGDQDLSGISTNAADIATINDDAIFSDPASPNEIDFGWLGTRAEYDALVSKPITKMFFVSSFGFLNSVVVSGQTPVNITDSEVYTATVDSNAPDLTYSWTVTGTTDATINGSATSSTVTVDYAGNIGDPDSFADIKCVVSSIDVGESVEDTLQITVEHMALPTQSFKITSTTGGVDVAYGVDPLVSDMIDHGTSGVNLTQSNPSNQASVIAGSSNVIRFGSDDYYAGVEPQSGDFTYEWEIDMTNALGVGARLLSGTTGRQFLKKSSNEFRMTSAEGNNNDFTGYSMTGGMKTLRLVKEGSEARLYENGVLKSTILSLTGTFGHWVNLGQSALSITSDLARFDVYSSAINP